jgi:uncharacterized protein
MAGRGGVTSRRMSERDGYEPGVPCWVDHSSPDPQGAAAFYGALFGWETEDQMPPEAPGSYFMCRLRGRNVAALGSQSSEGARAMWNSYVWVDSADDAVERAKTGGGTATGDAFDVFDAGRMAVLVDPAGATIGVWQAERHRGAGLVNEPGALSWNELMTRDVFGAQSFYGAVFGWDSSRMDYDGGDYYLWQLRGTEESVGGMVPMVGEQWPAEMPAQWVVYFAVEDADATAARAKELGGDVSSPPFDTPAGRIAALSDPLGAAFSVIRLPAS